MDSEWDRSSTLALLLFKKRISLPFHRDFFYNSHCALNAPIRVAPETPHTFAPPHAALLHNFTPSVYQVSEAVGGAYHSPPHLFSIFFRTEKIVHLPYLCETPLHRRCIFCSGAACGAGQLCWQSACFMLSN